MKRVSFYTLGCKLNQAETAILAEQCERIGCQVVPFGSAADLCVINTCTVTGKTDYRCRQMIRRAKKDSPDAAIAVVGCYAQLQSEKIKHIAGVDYILGSDTKFRLFEVLADGREYGSPVIAASENRLFQNPNPGNFWDHTRAFLKIQDGCDNACSYCTVPVARGRSRSDTLEHIVAFARELAARGHREIVLTGVHIGLYGRDVRPKQNLLTLLMALEHIAGIERIRLSSLEPLEISDELIQWVAESKKVCPHFHVPLQSGDDDVLKRMNRNYSGEQFARVVQAIKTQLPLAGLGSDVIVGFPGETEAQFQNSVSLIEQLPFTYLHVFSYSPRPGTKAADFPGRIDPRVTSARSELLRQLGKLKKRQFIQSQIGQRLTVLWEEKHVGQFMSGLTGSYIKVKANTIPELLNRITPVKIDRAHDDFAVGHVADDSLNPN
ncbi:MAG: tRNA (N(6)-L-threonylcarbamoyladenosine(37)-C(2))-methylthiotransferase MtaB [Candidatus Zhuqueibacterota bacterium]